MGKKRYQYPRHIQVALDASLMVRVLTYPPLLVGILLLPEYNLMAVIFSALMIVVWIPLAYGVTRRTEKPIAREIINLHTEAWLVGLIVPLVDFNPVFILVVVVIVGMGGVAYGGFWLCAKRYVFLAIGIGISVYVVGFSYKYEAWLSTVAIMGLSVLFSAFAISYGSLVGAKEAVSARKALKNKKAELEQLNAKLAKYLSPQVYDSIFQGKQEVRIGTHRKRLTVFFSDIKDFTKITENMESEALASLLNSYLNEMAEIALRHGGTIDKFIGDAILIFFGDPESKGKQEDAEACVLMALEMRERMQELRKKWKSEGVASALHIRCGITTGFCTVGNFGSENRLDYTIIGGQVNIAARLELEAQPDHILISQETHALVKNKVLCEKKDEITVKGIAYPIETFQVVDLRDRVNTGKEAIDGKISDFIEQVENENLSPADKDYIAKKILQQL